MSHSNRVIILENLKRQTGVTDEQLNKEVNDLDLDDLSEHIVEYRKYGQRLHLSEADVKSIERDPRLFHSVKLITAEVFKEWHRKLSFEATYRELVEVALKLEDGIAAKKICEVCVEEKKGFEVEEEQEEDDVESSPEPQPKLKKDVPPKITKRPTIGEKRILIQAEGSKPIKYQWFKDDEKLLSSNDDYKGPSTQELIVMGTGPQVKGNYKCLVANKYGKVVSAHIHYDPFVVNLLLNGVSRVMIAKLMDIGITSMNDLQPLQEESDYSVIGLTVFERRKLKNFISLHTEKQRRENQDKVLRSFKQKLENRATLNQTVMQVILHGNAGVGKTSLIKVLAGDKVNEHEPSTPVMEEPKQIEISTIIVNGSESVNWKYLKTLKEEAGFIVGQANYTRSVDTSVTKPNNKSGGITSQKHEERSVESRYQEDEESQSQDIKLSETVTDSEAVQKAMEVMKKLEGEPWTLYISDVGGQLEFQELIPALTSGPSLHFIVISAKFKLNEHFPIVYRKTHKRDQDTQPYESHCSVKEGILQQISTILSTGLNGHEPKIIFILTFYDGNLNKLKEIDKELKELIRPIESDAFVPAGEELLCHPIDNINPAKEDVRRIQETVERIGECYKVGTGNYYTVQTPYSWLHFGIALREKKSPVLSYEECAEIGDQCGIPNKEGIDEALEFLHSKVGTVRFFNNNQTLRDIVITKPSILFENVTKLLEDTFTFKSGPRQHAEFQTKGIFQIEHALSRIKTKSELFTKEKFLAFLEHQYILARIKEDKFFMPCSLVHAAPVKYHLQDQVQTYPALLIAFSTTTQYVPRGVFGFMIAELLSHTPEDSYPTILRENKIFQNQVTFTFGPYQDEFRLSSFPSYIKIDVYESAPTKDREADFLLFKICCNFRRRIEASLKMVLDKFNYTKNADPVLAFFCTKCDQSHPAHMYDSTGLSITCNVKGWVPFPLNYQVWFGKPESDSKTFLPDIDQMDRDEGSRKRGSTDAGSQPGEKRPRPASETREIEGMKKPSSELETLCESHKLSSRDLNKEVDKDHILKICAKMGNPTLVANHLGLTQDEIDAIQHKAGTDLNEIKLQILQKWQSKRNLTGTATYCVLLEALLSSGCSETAVIEVFKLLKPRL